MSKLYTYFLIFCFFSFIAIQAQPLRLVQVDRVNNSYLGLDSIPNVSSITTLPNYQEFDQVNNRYILHVINDRGEKRLYSLDANTGNVLSNPLFPVLSANQEAVIDLQFDDSTGILYGLGRVRVNQSANGIRHCLVSINPSTGGHSIIDTIQNVRSIDYYQGHAIVDPIQGHYIFRSENPHRLYSIDVNFGNVIHNPLFPMLSDPNDNITSLQFDDSTGAIYGLYWDSSTQTKYFISVNPATGLHTIIDSIPGLKYTSSQSHRVTIDPLNHLYIFQGSEINYQGPSFLYSINIGDGSIAAKRPYSRRTNPDSIVTPYGLHTRHSDGVLFGMAWMNNVTTDLNELDKKQESFSIYPNPFNSQLTIQFDEEQEGVSIQLFDIGGQLMLSNYSDYLSSLKIERNGLPSGVYFLHIQSHQIQAIQKVIIR